MEQESIRARIARFEEAHRARGLPVTPQGRAVFAAILGRTDHPAADTVFAAVRRRLPRISRMTVYRILEKLARMDLVSRTCHPGPAARYDPALRLHHHLVCMDCGAMLDLEDDRLNDVPWPDVRRTGFQIKEHRIHFRGRCAACRKRGGKPAASGRRAPTRGRKRETKSKTGRT